MLRTANHLMGYKIAGTDGEIGSCTDFLFHDEDWQISYLCIDTGNWLPGRKVVIPPSVMGKPDWDSKSIPVSLTIDRIKSAPSLDSQAPVSVEYERECYEYFNWSEMAAATTGVGGTVVPPRVPTSLARSVEAQGDNHLRSMVEVKKYSIEANDGSIGSITDFIFDDVLWKIQYFVSATTSSWLPGKKVLIATEWINVIEWADQQVDVDLSIEQIKSSPAFDPSVAVNREYEQRLYDYYGKPVNW